MKQSFLPMFYVTLDINLKICKAFRESISAPKFSLTTLTLTVAFSRLTQQKKNNNNNNNKYTCWGLQYLVLFKYHEQSHKVVDIDIIASYLRQSFSIIYLCARFPVLILLTHKMWDRNHEDRGMILDDTEKRHYFHCTEGETNISSIM
jgi:hypothetical protein